MKVRSHRLLLIGALVLVLAGLGVVGVGAQGQTGELVTIESGQVVDDDLNVAAETVIIDGTVKGDVVVIARTITVNGTVEGDLMATGQVVVVNGEVQDDVRVAAQAVELGEGGLVGDDVWVGAFSFESKQGSRIGGNLWFGLYQALLSGEVAGDVKGGAGGLKIDGAVGGDVDVEVGDSSQPSGVSPTQFMPPLPGEVKMPTVDTGLTVTEKARVEGSLSYTSGAEARISGDAVTGPVDFVEQETQDEIVESKSVTRGNWWLSQVRRLIRLMVFGLLMVWLLPKWVRRSTSALLARPWASLGWGALSPLAVLVSLVIITMAILLIALLLRIVLGPSILITMMFGAVGGTLLIGYLVLLFYAGVLVGGLALSQLLMTRIKPSVIDNRWWLMVIAVVLVWILTLIPIVGNLIGLLLSLFGLGGIWRAVKSRLFLEDDLEEQEVAV